MRFERILIKAWMSWADTLEFNIHVTETAYIIKQLVVFSLDNLIGNDISEGF